MTETLTRPAPALEPGVIYEAYDRFVCASVRCAGTTALYTGVSIDGYRLNSVSVVEVMGWPVAELGPLRCECGSIQATIGTEGQTKGKVVTIVLATEKDQQ